MIRPGLLRLQKPALALRRPHLFIPLHATWQLGLGYATKRNPKDAKKERNATRGEDLGFSRLGGTIPSLQINLHGKQSRQKKNQQTQQQKRKGRNLDVKSKKRGGRQIKSEAPITGLLPETLKEISKLDLPIADSFSKVTQAPLKLPWRFFSRTFGQSCIADVVETKGLCIASLTLKLHGHEDIHASGESARLNDAKHIAGLRAVEKLKAADLIGNLCPDVETGIPKGKRSQQAAEDTQLDVFNYCARFVAIPEITVKVSDAIIGQNQRHTYTIELKEQNIRVSATSSSRKSAQLIANWRFKTAAQAYQAEVKAAGELPTTEVLGLTVETGRQFHEFYRTIDRSYRVNIHTSSEDSGNNICTKATSNFNRGYVGQEFSTQGMGRKTAEDVSYLFAAVKVAQHDTQLINKFLTQMKQSGGKIIRPAQPIDVDISDDMLDSMDRILDKARVAARGLSYASDSNSNQPMGYPSRIHPPPLTQEYMDHLSGELLRRYKQYLTSDTMARVRELKSQLPMNHYKKDVFNLVQDNVYSIVVGATGSGKTTQVPQIILEQYYLNGRGAECDIICTQPRRIAATSVADRVGQEMGPALKQHVGHHVRFDAKLPARGGSLTYCTTGILLAQLQKEPDYVLGKTSHLIIDEVHERDMTIDFTLTILKQAIQKRLERGLKVPRVTLMSATLDTELFSNYFKNPGEQGTENKAPILTVPGRTFPVKELFLEEIVSDLKKTHSASQLEVMRRDKATTECLDAEDRFARDHLLTRRAAGAVNNHEDVSDGIIDWKAKPIQILAEGEDELANEPVGVPYGLVATTIAHVLRTTTDGAILVFFPGLAEMQKVEEQMRSAILGIDFQDTDKYRLYMLHSTIANSQKTVFEDVPVGVRKIILSTNIAETSITITDVKHVIDCGQVRESRYNHKTRISKLQNTWISKSSAKQRAGRAGRVQSGHYLALYSKNRHDSMQPIGLPELLRSDLQTICLNIRSSIKDADIAQFLADAIEPPKADAVEEAINGLIYTGALTQEQTLTPLGKLLAQLPVHPTLGKMIVLGVLFKCIDPILVMANEERGLFIAGPEKSRSTAIKRALDEGTNSDHISTYRAFKMIHEIYDPERDGSAKRLAYDNNVHWGAWSTIYKAATQTVEILREAGLIPRRSMRDKKDSFGGDDLNVNSEKPHVVKAILLAGLSRNIALFRREAATGKRSVLFWRTDFHDNVMLASTSAVTSQAMRSTSTNPLAIFTKLVQSTDGNSMSIPDASVISPLAFGLFVDDLKLDGRTLIANGWLPLFMGLKEQKMLLSFRNAMDQIKRSAFQSLATGKPLHSDPVREIIADGVVGILDHDDLSPAMHHRANRISSFNRDTRHPLDLSPERNFPRQRDNITSRTRSRSPISGRSVFGGISGPGNEMFETKDQRSAEPVERWVPEKKERKFYSYNSAYSS